MEAQETSLGITLWQDFDEACRSAEAARDPLVKAAEAERDRVVKGLSTWTRLYSSTRIKAVAEARCDRKVKAAQDNFDAACRRAEEELMDELDEREKARDNVRYATTSVR